MKEVKLSSRVWAISNLGSRTTAYHRKLVQNANADSEDARMNLAKVPMSLKMGEGAVGDYVPT